MLTELEFDTIGRRLQRQYDIIGDRWQDAMVNRRPDVRRLYDAMLAAERRLMAFIRAHLG